MARPATSALPPCLPSDQDFLSATTSFSSPINGFWQFEY
jgi:hypothetical protein